MLPFCPVGENLSCFIHLAEKCYSIPTFGQLIPWGSILSFLEGLLTFETESLILCLPSVQLAVVFQQYEASGTDVVPLSLLTIA